MASNSSDSDTEIGGRFPKKHKKEKKSKKVKKEKKYKKSKKHKKRTRRSSTSSSGSGNSKNEWVERVLPSEPAQKPRLEREDWMNSMLVPTYSKEPNRDEKKPPVEQYNPQTNVRELNPHWRNGGSGLPNFRRPQEDEDVGYSDDITRRSEMGKDVGRSGGWKKSYRELPQQSKKEETKVSAVATVAQEDGLFMSDQQLNDLGAKIVKAEIMGNIDLAKSLKEKLAAAKLHRSQIKEFHQNQTNKQTQEKEEDLRYTVSSKSSDENSRQNRKRRNYQSNLPPGDLADKFRSERQENADMDAQFFKVSAKLDREASNLENIFDHGRASTSSSGQQNEEKIVRDMNKLSRAQAECERCLNSSQFLQDHVVSMGKNIFLAVPSWKALQPKHCLVIPIGHYSAITHMDEDVHRDLIDTCKALKRMFSTHNQEVIFFETVRYINRNPHTYVQCVPASDYEMAPFYFKKAILESETEWAMNKKLHNIQGLDIRRTVPKGLPYFWVSFNLESGFAHVIEDQESFPVTFASETIAGILGLETRDWRKPGREHHPKQRVQEFKHWWKEFDNLTPNE
ncbi:CWF19-like protein 2 [Wyeomyia smithii]|uniref:CWF19-like protein 2 n=1 Tax=Wyeomyia smithii TaxID=174621 RepID=UPI0024680D7B|nr:CWF19-like protein 2 [Wyeomyia smithii]